MINRKTVVCQFLFLMWLPMLSLAEDINTPSSNVVDNAIPKYPQGKLPCKKNSAINTDTDNAAPALPAVRIREAATRSQPAAENAAAKTCLPRSGRIRFAVTRGEGGMVVAESIHEWHHDGLRYTMTATTRTTGLAALLKPATIVQISQGSIQNGNLKPALFHYDRGDNDIVEAVFDWSALRIRFKVGSVEALEAGTEDLLSMFYQLMQVAQNSKGLVMAVTNGRKVERYAFEWLGDEELRLKTGRVSASHVRVTAVSGGRDTTEVWLGREVAGLPVKIRNTDRKGAVFDQVAEELDYEGK